MCVLRALTPPSNHVHLTFPVLSAIIWTSICRADGRYCSTNTPAPPPPPSLLPPPPPSPNAPRASLRQRVKASSRSPGRSTKRMPRPPPPFVALSRSGYAADASSDDTYAFSEAWSVNASRLPAKTGTPHASARARARVLSPKSAMHDADGPTKVTPLASHSSWQSSSMR